MDDSAQSSESGSLPGLTLALVQTLRPKQWTKNLLVFLPLFFTVNEAWDLDDVSQGAEFIGRSVAAFLAFSVLSGAIYIFNDLADADRDRAHPRKKFRPIASGRLPKKLAFVSAVILGAVPLGGAFILEPRFGAVALGYAVTMIAYSLALKSVVLLDVFAVGSGFVLRVVAGAAALQVPISPWLYLCTGLGALFIALSKRRSELASAGESASQQRDILGKYTLAFLDQLTAIVATSALISYSLYTFTAPNLPDNHAMMFTIPFVTYGLFRYMYLVHTRNLGENPEDIVITDAPMIISIVLWLSVGAAILIAFRS
ncbi:MAG: decaprenyl-phosphate phosphoribosyltransferase [SAR202 cluster bacterium]|jgi:4-hydroxybenzoate polyprenyltransferase|nr:decaprenyl-phosphate phosphoribosyltransferase [SAR202 cluster bacterium]